MPCSTYLPALCYFPAFYACTCIPYYHGTDVEPCHILTTFPVIRSYNHTCIPVYCLPSTPFLPVCLNSHYCSTLPIPPHTTFLLPATFPVHPPLRCTFCITYAHILHTGLRFSSPLHFVPTTQFTRSVPAFQFCTATTHTVVRCGSHLHLPARPVLNMIFPLPRTHHELWTIRCFIHLPLRCHTHLLLPHHRSISCLPATTTTTPWV